MEIWRDIKGYEGDYQISSNGRVKSLKFNISTQKYEHIMKPQPTWGGYLRVALRKDGKIRLFAVHRLVAEAFIPNLNNKPVVNHINGNRQDNKLENLEWVTHKENSNKSKVITRSDRYNSIKVIDSEGNTFDSYREASRYWGLAPNTVKRDVLGITKYSDSQRGSTYEREIRFRRG